MFGKPADFLGDKREWRHFEWVFRNWFGFLYDAAEEWLDEAAVSVVEMGEAVQARRETDKARHMSLAMVCKNDALDVVKESHGEARVRVLAQTLQVWFCDWDVAARVLESPGVRLRDNGWLQEETAEVGEPDCRIPERDR